MSLDVLVYSEVPAERLVFINGKKYLEGQTVDGDAVLEQITQDGAVLRQQGQRIVLRPKLNPYARARGRLDTIAVALGQWLGRAGSGLAFSDDDIWRVRSGRRRRSARD